MYVAYIRMKTQERDWHAVADAAMDIRELLTLHPYLEGGKRHGRRSYSD